LQLLNTERISRVEHVEDGGLEHVNGDLVRLICEKGRDFGAAQVEKPVDAAVGVLLAVE